MAAEDRSAEARAIEQLIARQFASVSWAPGRPADWQAFVADFHPDARLYPAARPAQRQTVEGFVERMTPALVPGESMLRADVHVFGNTAAALAACEIVENEAEATRGVEVLLLIKNGGARQIVSQAWDVESEGKPLPERFLAGTRRD